MTMTLDPNECQCGRELKLLNQYSDTPKCVGCGRLSELCECEAVR